MVKDRITIMINNEQLLKLRTVQAKMIKESKENWSFSSVLSIVLTIGVGAKDFDELIMAVIENGKKKK